MEDKIKNFRDLKIWQKGVESVKEAYKVTNNFPKEELYGLHNKGWVESTKNRRPLKLIYYEACLNQQDALHREKYLRFAMNLSLTDHISY